MKKKLFAALAMLLPLTLMGQAIEMDTTKVNVSSKYRYVYKDTMLMGGDGYHLRTQFYLPEGEGPWPLVVTRTPYVFTAPGDNDNTAREFARRGMGYVIQYCRGIGGSEGTYEPNVYERADGLALANWLNDQPWVKSIGLTGFSYLGLTCWIIADVVPEKVKGIYLHHYGVDKHLNAYNSGLFRQDIMTAWSIDNAKELKEKPPVTDRTQPYYEQMRYMPQMEMDERMLGARLPWYRDWISHTDYTDPFWHTGMPGTLRSIPEKIKIPMTIVAGHFDHHNEGTLLGYTLLSPETKAKSRLILGAWNHFYQTTPNVNNPQHAQDIDLQADMFNWMWQVLNEGVVPKEEVQVYAIGADKWLTLEKWSDIFTGQTADLYLSGQTEGKARRLMPAAPSADGQIRYAYDPQNPVLSVGGENLFNSATRRGSQPQPEVGYRDDVISFLSEPLEAPLTISGNIMASLFFSSDCEDTSVCYKVSEEFADGSTYNIRTGITTLAYRNDRLGPRQTYTPGEVVELGIEAQPIVWQLQKGSRIRIDITSSDFPQFSIHSNYAGVWSEQTATKVAHQTLYVGGRYPSKITLPIADLDSLSASVR